jgi:hypothetical protein
MSESVVKRDRRCHAWARHVLDVPENWLCLICKYCGEQYQLEATIVPLRLAKRKSKLIIELLNDPNMPEAQKRFLFDRTKRMRPVFDRIRRRYRKTKSSKDRKRIASKAGLPRVFSFTQQTSRTEALRKSFRKADHTRQVNTWKAMLKVSSRETKMETEEDSENDNRQQQHSEAPVPAATDIDIAHAVAAALVANEPQDRPIEDDNELICKEDASLMLQATTPLSLLPVPANTSDQKMEIVPVSVSEEKEEKSTSPPPRPPQWSTFFTMGTRGSSATAYRGPSSIALLSYLSKTTVPEPEPIVLAHPLISKDVLPPALLLPPPSVYDNEDEALIQRAFKPNSPYKPFPVMVTVL